MLSFSAAVLLVFIAAVCWHIHNHHENNKRFGKLPSVPYALPVLGHLPFVGKHLHKTFSEWSRRYGSIFRVQLGVRQAVVVNGRNDVKKITDMIECAIRPDLPIWQKIREEFTFAPTIDGIDVRKKVIHSMSVMKNYCFSGIVDECCEELVNKWVSADSLGVRIMEDVTRANSKVMFAFTYGHSDDEEDRKRVETLAGIQDGFSQAMYAISVADSLPWLLNIHPYYKRMYKEFIVQQDTNEELALQHINKRLENSETADLQNVDNVLDALKAVPRRNKDGTVIDQKHLMLQIQTVTGAALDTTSAVLSWCILLLAKFPRYQSELWEELNNEIDVNQVVDQEDTSKLIMMEAFVNEVLRYVSILPFTIPHCTTKDVDLGDGMIIPANTFLFINLWSANHDEQVWEDPGRFQPERFIKDGALDKEELAGLMTFSHGRRRCIGEVPARTVIRLFIANLVRRCDFSLADEYKNVDIDDVYNALTLRPPTVKIIVRSRILSSTT